ncbi:MAG: sel1 repeat family protein [Proteobacteria bacterium]|nr:sel1 repeat family protein [Pseudomonadota bacterium]
MMKNIILICIVSLMIAGCTRSPESSPEVKSAASSEISKVSMEKAILKNGRVCTYPAGSQIHAQYYENLQKTDVSVNEHSQSVSDDETEDETVQIENGQECDDHTECPAGSACLPDHRSEDGYNVVRICKNMTGLSCTTDLDCPDYEFCSSGKCIMCSTDADCRSGFTCSQNICQPKNVSPSCTSSAQCGRGEICAFGECSSFCSYKDDCGEGRICQRASSVDGICVRVHPEKFSDVDAKPCLSSEDYNSQSVCRTDKTESCRSDEDCANRSQDRRCDVGGGECVECLSDADCHGERPLCSADHQCEECVASANCAEGLKCGRPPKRIGEMSDDRNHCLECVNDSECSPEKPFCNLEGKCQAVQCMKDTDCCFLEVCSGHRCRKKHSPGLLARKAIVSGGKSDCCFGGSKWGADDHIFSGTVVEEMATKQELYHNYIEEQRTMHVGYHEWHICQQHMDCGYIGDDEPGAGSNVFDSWCSPVYHQCVDINQKIPKRSYSNNGFVHGIFNNDYTLCWRDSQCPDGQVCNEYGRCGCTPDSCAEGLECSVRFGCVCNHDSACGSLVCRNSRCACSEDSQCGQGKLCGSDGSCYDANDPGALYEEGLNWFVDYHKRPRDLKKAEQFFVKASDLGLTEAMIRLAEIRFEQNQAEEGIGLLKKASDNQNAEAMYRLGLNYLKTGSDGTAEMALKYLTKSAALNYGPAMIKLAEIYMNGEKTAEDIQKSQSYIQKYYTYSPGAVRDNLRVDTNAFELRNIE